jgi:hypothetical protein
VIHEAIAVTRVSDLIVGTPGNAWQDECHRMSATRPIAASMIEASAAAGAAGERLSGLDRLLDRNVCDLSASESGPVICPIPL